MSRIYLKNGDLLVEEDIDIKELIVKHKHDLADANLYDLDLSNLDLTYANLTCCNLNHVNFFGTNLTGANLYGSTLIYVKFNKTITKNANFTNTKINWKTNMPIDIDLNKGTYHFSKGRLFLDNEQKFMFNQNSLDAFKIKLL